MNAEGITAAARQMAYHVLAVVTSDPRSRSWERLRASGYRDAIRTAGEHLRAVGGRQAGELAPGERAPEALDLEGVLAFLDRASPAQIEEEFQRIFGFLLAKDCPPYETEYCPQTFSVYRAQKIGDVAGYYRAFGLEPSRELPERHDHISLELEFMAWVIGKARYAEGRADGRFAEGAEVCNRAEVRFFREHLCWWAPAFATALWRKAEGAPAATALDGQPRTLYGAVGLALSAFIGFERRHLEVPPPRDLVWPRPVDEPGPMACSGCEDENGG